MGGGDLNMKKHFHPLTMENLERVWKAEEKKRVEDERIHQLQEELAAERQKEVFEQQAIEAGLKKKKGEKLDWMYQGQQTVDTEAYLLGKKIDKNIEIAKEEVKGLPNGHIPTQKTSLPKANDVLAKIKEDPLFLIKKREVENRKNLLANPVKLRKMKELIQEQTSSLDQEKRHKKKDRKRRQTSSSDEESSDEIHKREKRHKSRSQSPSCSFQKKNRYEERSVVDSHDRKSKYTKSNHGRDDNERYAKRKDRHYETESSHNKNDNEGYTKGNGRDNNEKYMKENDRCYQSGSGRGRDDNETYTKENGRRYQSGSGCGLDENETYTKENDRRYQSGSGRDRDDNELYTKGNDRQHHQRQSGHDRGDHDRYNKGNERHYHEESSRNQNDNDKKFNKDRRYHGETERVKRNQKEQKRFYNDRTKDSSSSSDEDDQLEAQRNAMINNARWRQEQRSTNTKKYKTEREAEEKDIEAMLKKSKSRDEKADFVQKLQKESLSTKGASVEDRIHRNIHSKQRTNAALNKKFTSR